MMRTMTKQMMGKKGKRMMGMPGLPGMGRMPFKF